MLLELSGDKFINNEHRKQLRKGVLLSDNVADSYNKGLAISGIYFEVDKEATKKLSEKSTTKTLDSDKAKEERETMKLEAGSLGIEFPSNIPNGKLFELIQNAKK